MDTTVEAFEEFRNTIIELWESVRLFFQNLSDSREKIAENNYIRSTWIIQLDTRQHSQVISRKPLFAIQKVI